MEINKGLKHAALILAMSRHRLYIVAQSLVIFDLSIHDFQSYNPVEKVFTTILNCILGAVGGLYKMRCK